MIPLLFALSLAFAPSVSAGAKLYTEQDVKNNVCFALCRNDGFDLGYFEKAKDSCVCGQRRKYKDATDKVIRVVPKKQDEEDFFIY